MMVPVTVGGGLIIDGRNVMMALSGVGLKDDVPAEVLEPEPAKAALENTAIRAAIQQES